MRCTFQSNSPAMTVACCIERLKHAADCGSSEEISSTEPDFIEFCGWFSICPSSMLASEPIQLKPLHKSNIMALLVEWMWRPAPLFKVWEVALPLSLSTPFLLLNSLTYFPFFPGAGTVRTLSVMSLSVCGVGSDGDMLMPMLLCGTCILSRPAVCTGRDMPTPTLL